MTPTRAQSRQAWFIVALGAPLAAVAFAAFVSGKGPRSATATPVASDGSAAQAIGEGMPILAPVSSVPTPPTKQQIAAFDWLRAHSPEPGLELRSPLISPSDAPANEPAVETIEPSIPGQAPRLDVPKLRITGIMTGNGVNYVSLNHRLSRVGDEVAPGWTVKTIDAARQAVEIKHTGGTVLELFVDRPKLGGDQ